MPMQSEQSKHTKHSEKVFTGRVRRKRTRLSVRLADLVAERLITIGGIGTIVAVSLVFVFLFSVVWPLFRSASLADVQQVAVAWSPSESPLKVAIDEYRTIGWALHAEGTLDIFRPDTGELLERRTLFEGNRLTAVSTVLGHDIVAIGFEDGTLRFGRLGFDTEFRDLVDVSAEIGQLSPDAVARLEGGMVKRTQQGQFRLQKVVSEFQPALSVADGALLAIDHIPPGNDANPLASKEFRFAFVAADKTMQLCRAEEKGGLLSRTKKLQITERVDLPTVREDGTLPRFVLLSGRGDNVLTAWEDGLVVRYSRRDREPIEIAEQLRVLPEDGSRLTVFSFLLGRETVMCGDTQGRMRAWFRTRQSDPGEGAEGDGFRLTLVHDLPAASSAVTAYDSSKRNRMIAVGYEDGRLRIFQVTTRQLLLEQPVSADQPLRHVLVTPKDDGVAATTATQLWRADLEPGHPEVTLASLFTPVWYEGYEKPIQMWQSSFADVGPEMKLGLWPLVFGTIKATFYTMLFGTPLALMAALYTSEFLAPRLRSRIKPAIEMMASLPSVVLGFLAALVFAPYVERLVPATLASFVTVPLTFLAGAFLWQLLPHRTMLLLQRYRFWLLCGILPIGFAAAYFAGPLAEQWLFAGDIKRWLDGQIGSGLGAWLMLLLPFSAFTMALAVGLYANPLLRQQASRLSRHQFALLNALKFALAVVLTGLLALSLGALLSGLGLDPRGSVVGTYEQRNALVVGFVMGFAVIPIIYTIADDALATVPSHLRSASLGCGATPWQTAVRVVIPTAMSGLFSALMIGLGRAVGETMIVLMAGGNTPVTDWNIFNGFRTLSANIAVELPEAVRNSTHYRTLFLAALTLFLLTFVVNTVAEVVRLRFRRRAYQL